MTMAHTLHEDALNTLTLTLQGAIPAVDPGNNMLASPQPAKPAFYIDRRTPRHEEGRLVSHPDDLTEEDLSQCTQVIKALEEREEARESGDAAQAAAQVAFGESLCSKFCSRCGRSSHTVKSCYASYHVDGSRISSEVDDPPRGRFIANIQGSSFDAPEKGSWKLLVDKYAGLQTQCVVVGCSRAAEEGAHVWVKGERKSFFIAPLCKGCNHRHGEEEICWCRYIENGEDPKEWMAIKDVWLLKY